MLIFVFIHIMFALFTIIRKVLFIKMVIDYFYHVF